MTYAGILTNFTCHVRYFYDPDKQFLYRSYQRFADRWRFLFIIPLLLNARILYHLIAFVRPSLVKACASISKAGCNSFFILVKSFILHQVYLDLGILPLGNNFYSCFLSSTSIWSALYLYWF